MKCFNKLKADYAVLLSFISCMFFMGSCNIAYQYDIESGTEDDTADSTNVTIVTGEGIDVSMYESARIFPGLVDTLVDNTVNTLLALDLSKRYIPAYDLDVQQVPRPIYSTGLYAGAGELITITINDNTMGLTVIIGSHLDDLTDISPFMRYIPIDSIESRRICLPFTVILIHIYSNLEAIIFNHFCKFIFKPII